MKIKKLIESVNIKPDSYTLKYFIKLRYLLLFSLLLLQHYQAAAHPYGQNKTERTVTLKLVAATIPESLYALEQKTGCVINYNKALFSNGRINLEVKDMQVAQVLGRILANTHVGFKFADAQTILLYKLPVPPKPGKIAGKIFDEKGETLPGANIRVLQAGTGTQSTVDGSYILNLQPGTYTLEVSYVSYQTQRITNVVVTEDKSTPLNISLKPANAALKEVVVTANYRKASVEGLLSKQKNAAELSNGISAEQLIRTPDRNIGESLKRISGVSTVDNKFVLVRGIGERYNSAMLDGVVLPSTEAQSRNFSFDLIPSNLVDNVVVSKTVTPDMNASFGGGLVQINTKDIPNENFMSFSVGAGYNDQTTGKDFLSHKRGRYDYFGFDDGRRDYPSNLQQTSRTVEPNITLTDQEYRAKVDAQSKRFTNDNLTVYKYKAAPSQNYQFTIGRLLALDTASRNKLGFTGSLSYRNTQQITAIGKQRRGTTFNFASTDGNPGNAYSFNTTLGALLNVGLQLGKNRFSMRNTYTHMYDYNFVRNTGYGADVSTSDYPIPNLINDADDPNYLDLLQNKLNGQHQLGKVKIEWNLARTSIKRDDKDLTISQYGAKKIGTEYQYFFVPGSPSNPPYVEPVSRHQYHNTEKQYSWDVAATVPFTLGEVRSTIKTGYFGNRRKGEFDWQIAAFTSGPKAADSLQYLPVAEMLKPERMNENGFQYLVSPWFLDKFEGKSHTHAGYMMFDNRFLEKLRLVWGLRAEYYKYTEISNPNNLLFGSWSIKPDKRWQWLPSANLTYSPIASLNVRAAFSSSVVRPELMDNSRFWRYSPYLQGMYGNQGLYSTRINSFDFKTEWFPGLGEIISAGAFYKNFDKPAELNISNRDGHTTYYLKSADWAKVWGLEFEVRKSLSFIADKNFLNNLVAYGNLTLQKSEVKSTFLSTNPQGGNLPDIEQTNKIKRPMYGQTPYLINTGLQYTGAKFGFNAMYNKSGIKTYIVSSTATQIEYERPREQLDAQVSYRLMKKKLEIRFNVANILNGPSRFYRNDGSYVQNPNYNPNSLDISDEYILKPGFTNKYEDGDLVTFVQRFGRTYSTSITYNF